MARIPGCFEVVCWLGLTGLDSVVCCGAMVVNKMPLSSLILHLMYC